jgi:hypothetical protein
LTEAGDANTGITIPEGKKLFGKSRLRRKHNIKTDLKK